MRVPMFVDGKLLYPDIRDLCPSPKDESTFIALKESFRIYIFDQHQILNLFKHDHLSGYIMSVANSFLIVKMILNLTETLEVLPRRLQLKTSPLGWRTHLKDHVDWEELSFSKGTKYWFSPITHTLPQIYLLKFEHIFCGWWRKTDHAYPLLQYIKV